MVISLKNAARLLGISIMMCCAVYVCTLFLNYYIDLQSIKDQMNTPQAHAMYEAQMTTIKVVCAAAGGCLVASSVVMLIFYIKNYIDVHKKELGILKAMGYSRIKIAVNFISFGLSTFIGAALGYIGGCLTMPAFYETQNKDGYFPEMSAEFHPELIIFLIVIPSFAFALLSVLYAVLKLKTPVLLLIREVPEKSGKGKKHKESKGKDNEETAFLKLMKKSILRSKKSLTFFIIFSAFCFSAMTQMAFSMRELSSEMMGIIMLVIGLVLAFTTLFLATHSVVRGRRKTIAMMRVFGYSRKECGRAILGCYRPLAYVGFALGTLYQYLLLKIMVDVVFADMEGVPEYSFDFPLMLMSLLAFGITYEFIMAMYQRNIGKVSVKEVMAGDE